MPKIMLVQKGTETDADRDMKLVEDTPKLRELLQKERCPYEEYVPPVAEDGSPVAADTFLQKLQKEEAAEDAKPGNVQKLTDRFGTADAEIAMVTQAAAPVFSQIIQDLPKTIAKQMDDFLKRQTSLDGADHLAKRSRDATTEHRRELESMGLDVSDALLGFGKSGVTVGNVNEFYRVVFQATNSGRPAREFTENPKVLALIEGTDASGGFLVPEDHVIEIITNARERTVLWPRLRVRPTTSDTVKRPVRNTVGDVNIPGAAEVAAVTEVAIGYTEVTWTPHRMDAYFPASVELLQDSGASVEAEVRDAVSDEFAEQREKLPLVGSGTNQAQGILGTPGIGETAIGAAITVDRVLSAVYDMDDRYRRENSNLTMVLRGEAFKDYVVDLALNYRNPELLKLPVVIESRHVPQQRGVIGDMSFYWVYTNPLMRLVTQMMARNLRLDMVFWERWDGKVVRTDAFRKLNTITYT